MVDAKKEFATATSKLFVDLPLTKQKQILNWLNQSQSREENEWHDLVTEINSEAPKLLKSINHQRKNNRGKN